MPDASTSADRPLAGRVALITGGTRGIGRAIAQHFYSLGAEVAVNARTDARARAAAMLVGDRALGVGADVSKRTEVREMVDAVIARFDRLDILVNNAAIAHATRIDEISEAEWRETIDVNLTGAFLCLTAVIPRMRDQKFGRVINISSLAGRSVSLLGGAHYTASKAGMLGLTRAAAKELGPAGITVNAICPGLIDTELARENSNDERRAAYAGGFPARRLGTAHEVAELAAFLAGDGAAYITGASLDINGGSLML
ncbi:MAG: SDR family oxidoreductase [Gemmatimonadota bacterium]|nr:SDR family oxidoreductase [Gemmatimonadota bacterium]